MACKHIPASTQSDTVKIAERAMFLADILVNADTYQNWNIYADLSIPRIISPDYGRRAWKEEESDGHQTHLR